MHALWLALHALSLVGRCSRGLAWLSASICHFMTVFYLRGIRRCFLSSPPPHETATSNSLEFPRGPGCVCVATRRSRCPMQSDVGGRR